MRAIGLARGRTYKNTVLRAVGGLTVGIRQNNGRAIILPRKIVADFLCL